MTDAGDAHLDSFAPKQFAFELQVAAVAAERAAGADHPVAWGARVAAFTHDVADGPVGARATGERGDVAVGGDAPGRDAADGGEHARAK
jgi:hypothetical protein